MLTNVEFLSSQESHGHSAAEEEEEEGIKI